VKRDTPVLGLIFPPAGRGVPDEGLAMYGDRLHYVVTGLGVERMTPEGFNAVLARIPAAAEQLANAGADAIELTGTSLTFYQGEAFNRQLCETVRRASGLPATTMSNGVIDALKAVGARRVAVATAYNEDVNARLRAFLIEHGLEPVVITGLGIEAIADVDRVTQEALIHFGVRVRESAPEADALLVSCGGFRTLEIISPLEARTGVPVITSMPHGLWAGARLAGLDGAAPGYGRLLSRTESERTTQAWSVRVTEHHASTSVVSLSRNTWRHSLAFFAAISQAPESCLGAENSRFLASWRWTTGARNRILRAHTEEMTMVVLARRIETEKTMHERSALQEKVENIEAYAVETRAEVKRVGAKADAVLATVTEHRIETRTEFGKLRTGMAESSGALRGEMEKSSTALRTEMEKNSATLRNEMDKNSATLRNEIEKNSTALHNEMEKNSTDLRTEMEKNSADLRTEMEKNSADLRTEMEKNSADLRAEMEKNSATLRAEMEKNSATLRAEMEKNSATLRVEMEKNSATLRAEMEKSSAALRAEMIAGDNALRTEMIEGFGKLRTEMATGFGALRVEMTERFGAMRVETRELIEEFRRDRRTLVFAMIGTIIAAVGAAAAIARWIAVPAGTPLIPPAPGVAMSAVP
jgi:arylmalonate decarboxylase